MRRQKTAARPNSRAKWVIITIAGAIVLLLAIAIAYSQYAWGQYIERNDAMYTDQTSRATTDLQNVDTPDDVRLISDTLHQTSQELCAAPFLTGLRERLSESAQQYQQDCRTKQQQLAEAHSAAQTFQQRLSTEKSVADVFRATSKQLAKVKDSDYPAARKVWREAKVDINSVSVDASYDKSKQAQLAAIDAIMQRYEAVEKANKAQQRPQFDDAIADLRTAYAKLEDTKKQARDSYQEVARNLYVTINAL